jgi:TolB protein
MHRLRLILAAALVALAASAASTAAPADEERILFHRQSGTGVADLFSVRPDGSGLRRLTATRNNFGGVWSPDGRRIAFSSDRGRGSGAPELYVMDADGRNVRRLTRTPLSARAWSASFDPAWSPDGSTLVFARTVVDGPRSRQELFAVGADGSRLRRLTDTPRVAEASPSWAPDGTAIAYERDGGIWTMAGDGTRPRRIAAAGGRPAWSPDGARIAFAAGNGWIAVVGPDGRARRNVVRGHGSPAWSADGTRLVFGRADGLYTARAAGTGVRRLTRPPELRHDLEPDWRPAR